MTRKQRRLSLIASAAALLAVAATLVLSALKDSLVFFNSPSDIAEKHVAPGTRIRLGGLVALGTVVRSDNLNVKFEVTDGNRGISVAYQGILPDLFREGQGVVTEGVLQPDGIFRADNVLAKHDERYMPKDVADALKKSGHWKEESGRAGAGVKSAGGGS